MRKISADYIYPVTSEPIKDGVIILDDTGKIIAIENSCLLYTSDAADE